MGLLSMGLSWKLLGLLSDPSLKTSRSIIPANHLLNEEIAKNKNLLKPFLLKTLISQRNLYSYRRMGTMAVLPPREQSKVDPKNINRAVNSLLKWWDSKSKSQNSETIENDGFVYVIVTLKKIPQIDRTNPFMIPIPHPLIDLVEDTPELCLIIDDRHKNKITKEAALKKIEAEKIPITKVIKVSKLKSDLRKLEPNRCELYFAERRLMPILPKLLGKEFVKKKKNPIAINLKHGDWKEQIEKACESALFFLGTGTCSVVKVAKLSMGKKEIAENIMAAINGIGDSVPGKWKNVKLFHVKLLESLALPVYQSDRNKELEPEI